MARKQEEKPKKRRELKPKGYCIFCNSGFIDGDGRQVGNVKRQGHAIEWFHMDCYERYVYEKKTGRKAQA